VEIDLTARTVVASAVARRIYGWEEDVLSLTEIQASALPEYRAEIDDALEKLIHLRQEFNIQYKIKRRSDGAIRDIQVMAEYNPQENTVVGSIQDITQRKLIMQVLMENEEKFRTLFEKASDMIIVFDANGGILDANKHTCDLLGYSREELLKMKVIDLQAPQVRSSEGLTIKDEFKMYGSNVFESVDQRKDGTTFPVEVTLSRVVISSGIRFFGIVRDISERKRIEQELKEQIDTLKRIQDVSVDRELLMVDLKQEINALLLSAGEKEKYHILKN
jgi:PAS domain S-box-containing protein